MPLRSLVARLGGRLSLAQELVLLAGVVIVATLAVALFAFKRTGDASGQSCVAALHVRDAIRDVLVDAQQRTEKTPPQTSREQDRQQALEFYDRSIARLNRVTCTQ